MNKERTHEEKATHTYMKHWSPILNAALTDFLPLQVKEKKDREKEGYGQIWLPHIGKLMCSMLVSPVVLAERAGQPSSYKGWCYLSPMTPTPLCPHGGMWGVKVNHAAGMPNTRGLPAR